jgi:hypothetical protein
MFLNNHPSNNSLRLFHPYLTTLFVSSTIPCYLISCVSMCNNLVVEDFLHELISILAKILGVPTSNLI